MQAVAGLVAGLGVAILLAGCGQKSEQPVMPSSAPLAVTPESAAAPAPPTPEQQKLLAALPAPYNTGDPAAGEAKVAQCKSCHAFVKGGPNLTGPALWGVFGTKAAAVAGFSFSDGLKASNLTWDAPTLDKWIADPRGLVPQTKMTFLGIKDPKDRQDVIAYLALQRDP